MPAKRLLDCTAADLVDISKPDLLYAIRASEGRVLVSESVAISQPLIYGITNAEVAASQGADIVLINMFDAEHPVIQGLPAGIAPEDSLRELQRLTGRVVGVNLEAVDPKFADATAGQPEVWQMSPGRAATPENARRVADMGAKLLVLTGNPSNGVSNRALAAATKQVSDAVGDRAIIATGKMHGAGVVSESGAAIITEDDVAAFAKNGADIVLIPAPGTVPGMSQERVAALIKVAHDNGALAMTTVGTSQEGADVSTIRQIALMSKMAGADLHHIGDAGYTGMAIPENIFAYSVAIRGLRHTYARVAQSINR